jgi:hypothetical protein
MAELDDAQSSFKSWAENETRPSGMGDSTPAVEPNALD